MTRTRWMPLALAALAGCDADRVAPPLAEASLLQTTTSITGRSLGTLGGAASYATDVNDAGTVVGWSEDATGQRRPFRWTDAGGMRPLEVLPGDASGEALRILATGQMLGTSTSPTGRIRVVRWGATGRISALPIAPPRETGTLAPADFNSRGEVVGSAFGNLQHGWYWSRATGTIDLRDAVPSCLENAAAGINETGTVAGGYCASTGWLHAFTWRRGGGYRDLGIIGEDSARGNATATDINAAGTVAGWMDPTGNSSTAPFLWNAATGFTFLPTAAGPGGFAYTTALADNGTAVGGGTFGADGFGAMAWPNAQTMIRLDGPTGQTALATAVNSRGVAVGWEAGASGGTVAVLWRLSGAGSASMARESGGAFNAWGLPPAEACVADRAAMGSRAAMSACAWRGSR